jgi:hypothetical protein
MEYYMLKLQTELEMAKSSETEALNRTHDNLGYPYEDRGDYDDEEEDEDEDDDDLISGEWTDAPLVNHRQPPPIVTPLKLADVAPEESDDEEEEGEGGEEIDPIMYDPHRGTTQQEQEQGPHEDDQYSQEVFEQQEALIAYCTEALERGEELPAELQEMLAELGIDIERQPLEE